MGKTVVKQSDVEKLYDLMDNGLTFEQFEEVVQEVFAIYDDTEKENK